MDNNLKLVEDLNQSDTTIILDGHYYLRCKFSNCRLVFSGGDYGWSETSFDNTTIHWNGAAHRTIEVAKAFGLTLQAKPQEQPENLILPPKGNGNGRNSYTEKPVRSPLTRSPKGGSPTH